MKIEIYGTGCPKCKQLESNAKDAAKQLNVKAEIIKVTDVAQIISLGIMMTPAISVDGKIIATGKILTAEEIKKYLR